MSEEQEGGERRISEFLEEKRTYGPGGVRWPALLAGIVCVGVVFAPVGAVACAGVAFLANHPIQRQWRGAFIILAAVFVLTTVTGTYLIEGGGDEEGPPGGDGVSGSIVTYDA